MAKTIFISKRTEPKKRIPLNANPSGNAPAGSGLATTQTDDTFNLKSYILEVFAEASIAPAGGVYSTESITSPDTTDNSVVVSFVTTSGTEAAEEVTVPDGTVVGQIKVVTLVELAESADSVEVVATNATGTGDYNISLQTEGDSTTLIWNGTGWIVQSFYQD